MRVYHCPDHVRHSPNNFIARGQVMQCPEEPRRAEILQLAAEQAGHEMIAADRHGLAPVRAVHDAGYLTFLEQAWELWSALPNPGREIIPNVHPGRNMSAAPVATVALAGHYQADTACPIGPSTWEGVQASANVAVSAAQFLMDQRDAGDAGAHAYALCRPPGHHAFGDQAGGFCFLNNSAIAAQLCLDKGTQRVAILDVDVHHGNGTQGIFYERADVLTVSLHGDPSSYYPFYAGYKNEKGVGVGVGFNHNHPLPFGTGDDDYLVALGIAIDAIRQYNPDVLVIALGLDASKDDPLAFLSITTDGFRRIGAALGGSRSPTLLVQEGGYISDSLGANLVAVLEGFESAR
ncbi:MAG: histone deacetylase family protein [Alphaproteobacteria bacterium]|nr:histone deacetylase family protein [Alphaproteobacteria bacterium]